MTTDDLLNDLLAREGGFVDNANDKGHATNWGITAMTLGEWRRLGRPATRAEVKALTVDEAKAIYRRRYFAPFDSVPGDELKAALVDFGANSGVVTAIEALQRVLGVPVDGVLGPRTRAAMLTYPTKLVVAALASERVKLFVQLVEHDATQRQWFYGWCKRAVTA